MRIIAGTARGRRLSAPPGRDTRPTADRVREALFSSLQPRLPGARVLDLFAGSGALGLEAASRGAAAVTLVERDRRALDCLRSNVAVVGAAGVEVVADDARRALQRPLAHAPFDLALLDPPYALDEEGLGALLTALTAQLAADATVVIERDRRAPPPRWPVGLLAEGSRRYGDTALHRARWAPADDADDADDQEPA